MKTSIKIIFGLALGASLLFSTGCKTVEGLGEDIESLGKSMQDKDE